MRTPPRRLTLTLLPVIALGLLRAYAEAKKRAFTDNEIRKAYEAAVKDLKQFLGQGRRVKTLRNSTRQDLPGTFRLDV